MRPANLEGKMLFPEEDSPALKDWIVKRLENTSDADADVLADYVLALLHNASDGVDIQAVFAEEITPFLKEDTKGFADDLIQTIKYKSYIPGAEPPPKAYPAAVASKPFFAAPSPNQPTFPTGPAGGSRKRGFHDRGDFDAPIGRDQGPGGRSFKQPRRGGGQGRNKGYLDLDRPRPTPQLQYGGYPNATAQHAPPYMSIGPAAAISPLDPSNPLEVMRKLQQLSQQLGIQMAALSDYSQQQNNYPSQRVPSHKRKGRCRDYDTKGYCARGQNCIFEHSNENEQTFTLPTPLNSGQIQLPAEEYDPNTAAIGAFPPQQSSRPSNNNHGNGGRDSSQGQQHRKKGGPRASFSAAGPVHDKSQTKVVIESIPEENFEEEQVRKFFSQFGNIVNVTMMPYKRLAILEYDNWGSANKAYRSPKVIFDNRFVKVFWYKEEKHGDIVNGNAGANIAKGGAWTTDGPAFGAAGDQMGEFEVEDMEEFARRQEEAQKNYEEKLRKKEEIEKQRAELEKRQKELQAKQEAEKQRLLARLGGAPNASSEQGANAPGTNETVGDAPNSSSAQTEALRATLAKLQEEAKAFGLDPNASPDDEATISTYSVFGRGGRGSGPRGRGYPIRGAYRGRGAGGRGNIHAAYAAFSLDNRPRKISISGVDFSVPEKDEALRQHLFSLGEFAAEIQITPSETHISFNDRKSAEKFYNSVKDKTVPGLADGEVEMSWVANTTGPLPGSSTTKVDTSSLANGAADERPDSVMVDANSAHQQNGGQGQQETGTAAEVDYDVGGENEWDVA